MNGEHRRNDWLTIAAIVLIVLGVWYLMGNVFGDWWQFALRRAFQIAWPLALIALGVLLYLASSRGALRSDTAGKKLYRSRSDRMIGGVLGGVAHYLGLDSTLVRVVFVLFGVLGALPAILVYVVAMVLIPEEPAGASAGPPPSWPETGPPRVHRSEHPSGGWPHTGRETVQTPPPPPEADSGEEPPPSAEGPVQS